MLCILMIRKLILISQIYNNKMRPVAILAIILSIIISGSSQNWVQYAQKRQIVGFFNDAIELPNDGGSYDIQRTALEQYQYLQYLYSGKQSQIYSPSQKATINSTISVNAQPSTNSYVATTFSDQSNGMKRYIVKVKKYGTQEVVATKVSQAYDYKKMQGVYLINTTNFCKVKITMDGILKNSRLSLKPPGEFDYNAAPIHMTDYQENTLEANLDIPGVWSITIQSKFPLFSLKLSTITFQTDSQNACQNFCYGGASERGSSGWDLKGQQCVCDAGSYNNPFFGCGSIQCIVSETVLGYSQQSYNSCKCIDKYQWDDTKKTCLFQCGKPQIPNSIAFDGDEKCTCEQNYVWNEQTSECQLMVECQPKYRWNYTAKLCALDCTSGVIVYSGYSGSPDYCVCHENTIWCPRTLSCIERDYYRGLRRPNQSQGIQEQGRDYTGDYPGNSQKNVKVQTPENDKTNVPAPNPVEQPVANPVEQPVANPVEPFTFGDHK